MNPRPTTKVPTKTLYGFPLSAWRTPTEAMTPLVRSLYTEALGALSDPMGPEARAWADELQSEGYRALTGALTLPRVLSLVSELSDATIVRLTGRAPTDEARQEVVRALYAPAA